jgi:hypothetical protein|nr:MAG TPA: hypothetical protein [Caudoviricetes sp.]
MQLIRRENQPGMGWTQWWLCALDSRAQWVCDDLIDERGAVILDFNLFEIFAIARRLEMVIDCAKGGRDGQAYLERLDDYNRRQLLRISRETACSWPPVVPVPQERQDVAPQAVALTTWPPVVPVPQERQDVALQAVALKTWADVRDGRVALSDGRFFLRPSQWERRDAGE